MEAIKPVLLFIRKNILSLLCAVVAIASLVVLYWPISNWFAELQTTADARKAVYTSMNTLLTKQRTLPLLNPLDAQGTPLTQFPTEALTKVGEVKVKELGGESAAILDAAKNAVTHKPLVPGALPSGGTMEATIFREQYQKIMPNPTMDADQLKQTLPATMLAAGAPPSSAAITAAQQADRDQIIAEKTQYDASGQAVNSEAVAALVADAELSKPDEMRAAAATNNKMYIAPDAIHINPGITGITPPSTLLMFNAQMSLWLIQDVFTALNAANDTPIATAATDASAPPTTMPAGIETQQKGVPASRVKHLLRMDYSDTPIAATISSDPNAPAPPAADPLHPANNPLASPTGHVSNGLYDVYPFTLKIIVDSGSIPDVLEFLSKNRFITVLKMDILTIDSGEALIAGYIYGTRPVVQLNLSCEELFFRQETVPFMPDPIRKALGLTQPVTPAT